MRKVILQALVIAAVASWAGLLSAQFWPLQARLKANDTSPQGGEDNPPPVKQPGDGTSINQGDSGDAGNEGGGDDPVPATWPPADGDLMIDVATAQFAWENGLAEFVDARSAEEYARAHIPYAWNVPQAAFTDGNVPVDFIQFVSLGTPLIIYCEGGDCDTSENVAIRLQDGYHYQAIYILQPGIPGWVEAGQPLEGEDVEGFVAELEQFEDAGA